MSGWRRYLLARAVERLDKARPGIHLIQGGADLHRQASEHVQEFGASASPMILLRLYWYARCLERSVHHAIKAEGYGR
jgi:hypothetical protein